VTDAVYDAGYNPAALLRKIRRHSRHAPAQFRAGGANARITLAVGACSMGEILVGAKRARHLRDLSAMMPIAGHGTWQDRFPNAELIGGDRIERVRRASDRFRRSDAATAWTCPPPRADCQRHAFQQSVWQALRKIHAGRTVMLRGDCRAHRTRRSGARMARGSVCGKNVAVAIPW